MGIDNIPRKGRDRSPEWGNYRDGKMDGRRDGAKPRRAKGPPSARRSAPYVVDGSTNGYALGEIARANELNHALPPVPPTEVEAPKEPVVTATPKPERSAAEKVISSPELAEQLGAVIHAAGSADTNQESAQSDLSDELITELKAKGYSENFLGFPPELQAKIISELDSRKMGPDVDTSGMDWVNKHKERHQFLPDMQADMDDLARIPEQRLAPQKRKSQPERTVEPPRETRVAPEVGAQLNEQRQASGMEARIDELRGELDILEAEARRPGARKDIEADVLGREAELRQLEREQKEVAEKREEALRRAEAERRATAERLEAERQAAIAEERNNARKQELRARLAVLEREARSPADFPHKHDELEAEVLAAEAELRKLDSSGQPQQEEAVVQPTAPEPEETPSTEGYTVEESDVEPEEVLISSDVSNEGTPAEMRQELANIVAQFEAPVVAAPEKSAGDQIQEYLAGRTSYQEATARKFSLEKAFRSLGERYNKLPFKAKLATGLALGVGAGAFAAAAAFPAAYACLGGIAAQRVAGLAGGFLKFEKGRLANDEQQPSNKFWKWGEKEKAMGKAMLYTAGMTGAMYLLSAGVREGVTYAQEHHLVDKATDWLGNILGHHRTPPPEGGVLKSSFPHSPIQEGMGERLAPEMPSVDAENGHGYEYMLKRLAEGLQAKHLDASDYPESSDIHKLLSADPSTIDQVVHRIAASAEHGFYKPDGTSVLVHPGAHMTIGASGEVHITNPFDVINAPEGAHTTPVYPHAPVEAPTTPVATAPEVKVEVPATGPTSHVDAVPPNAHAGSTEAPPLSAPAHEGLAPAPEVKHEFFMNKHNVPIYKGEAHFYGDASGKHAFLYSEGHTMSNTEKHDLIKEFLSRPKAPKVVYEISPMTSGGDKIKHVAWILDSVTKVPINPYQETVNKFLGAFSPWRGFSGPDDFRKFIP